MLNSVSCDVECWNMPFNMLKVVERCWTKLELGSIPFNKLPLVQCHLLNDVHQPLFEFRVTWVGGKINMAGWRLGLWLGCVRSIMAGRLGGDCASCLYLLAWRMIAGVSNWGRSFKDLKSMRRKFLLINNSIFAGVLPENVPKEVLFFL